jgi:uncharacterized protein (DUF427 family)
MGQSVEKAEGTFQATWNGEVVAKSDQTYLVEGNHYFPPTDINRELLADSSTTTFCPWKGTASYYDLTVDGQSNPGAVWYYPEPLAAAADIKDYVAFWRGVEVAPA